MHIASPVLRWKGKVGPLNSDFRRWTRLRVRLHKIVKRTYTYVIAPLTDVIHGADEAQIVRPDF